MKAKAKDVKRSEHSTFITSEKLDAEWSNRMIAYRTLLVVDTATPERLLKMGPQSHVLLADSSANGLALFVSWYFWNERFNNPSNPYHKREREGHDTLVNAPRWIAPWYGGPAESFAHFIEDMMFDYEEAYNLENMTIDEFLEKGARVLWFSCVVKDVPYPHYTEAEQENVEKRWNAWIYEVLPVIEKSCVEYVKKRKAAIKAKKAKKAKKA